MADINNFWEFPVYQRYRRKSIENPDLQQMWENGVGSELTALCIDALVALKTPSMESEVAFNDFFADNINDFCTWETTPQGQNFWSKVYGAFR